MKHCLTLRLNRKRNKARRFLEDKFEEGSIHDVFTQIRISAYTHNFGYDTFIESYMKRLEKKE